jgi:hypothetical protein
MSESYTPEEIEYWIKAYQRDLRVEDQASQSVRRAWRMAIAGLRLLLKEAKK